MSEDEDLSISGKATKNAGKEVSITLQQLKEEIYNDLKPRLVEEIVGELKKDFSNLAHRAFSLELVCYGILKRLILKEKLPQEFVEHISKQEDLVLAGVESMLKRLIEIELNQKAEEIEKNEKAIKDLVKKEDEGKA